MPNDHSTPWTPAPRSVPFPGPSSCGGEARTALASLVPEDGELFTVLELGCGDGALLELLLDRQQPGLRLIGLDARAAELDAARCRLGPGRVRLIYAPAGTVPLCAASVDSVLANHDSSVPHLADEALHVTLAHAHRVLRPGGLLAVAVQAEPGLPGAGGSDSRSGDEFPCARVARLLAESGAFTAIRRQDLSSAVRLVSAVATPSSSTGTVR